MRHWEHRFKLLCAAFFILFVAVLERALEIGFFVQRLSFLMDTYLVIARWAGLLIYVLLIRIEARVKRLHLCLVRILFVALVMWVLGSGSGSGDGKRDDDEEGPPPFSTNKKHKLI